MKWALQSLPALLFLFSLLDSAAGAKSAAARVRQCNCAELERCRERQRAPLIACQRKCVGRLRNEDWSPAAGRQCLTAERDEHSAQAQCMRTLVQKTCDNSPVQYLALNETAERPRHHRHRRHRRQPRLAPNSGNNSSTEALHTLEVDDEDDDRDVDEMDSHSTSATSSTSTPVSAHRLREHNKRAFHQFIRKHFGKSGRYFVACMNECGKKHQHKDECPKRLMCGTRRLTKEEWSRESGACQRLQKPRRFETCDCLKGAGVQGLDCTFGGKRDGASDAEV